MRGQTPFHIGLPLRKNVPSSYRQGIELDIKWKPVRKLTVSQLLNLSHNLIKSYTTDSGATSETYTNVTPLLTPSVISTSSVEYNFLKFLQAELSAMHMSRAYLDNTDNPNLVTPAFLIWNFRARIVVSKNLNINLFMNNITNKRYYTSGYVEMGQPYYYVQAPRNYFVNVQLKF